MFIETKESGEQQARVDHRLGYPAHIQAILEHADWMERLDAPDFDMRSFKHPCGTPACAFGYWAMRRQEHPYDMALSFIRTSGSNAFIALFSARLNAGIHTPQQWASHARNWCASQGYPA